MALTNFLGTKGKGAKGVIESSDWHSCLPKPEEPKREQRRILAIGLNGEKDNIREFYLHSGIDITIDEVQTEESAREYMKSNRDINTIIIADASYNHELYKLPFINEILAKRGHAQARMIFYRDYNSGEPSRLGADSVKDEKGLLRMIELYETGKVHKMPALDKKEIGRIVDQNLNPKYFNTAALQQ